MRNGEGNSPMRWARNIVGLIAILLLAAWICVAIPASNPQPFSDTDWRLTPQTTLIVIFDKSKMPADTFYSINLTIPGWIAYPYTTSSGFMRIIVVPHWIVVAITWALFACLWWKTRRPPKGHCQSCGQNLTSNEPGRCPECNSTIEREKRARKDSNPQPSVPKTDALSN